MNMIAATDVVYNKSQPKGLGFYSLPDDLPLQEIKYGSYKKIAKDAPDDVVKLVDQMMGYIDKDMPIRIDYRVRDLKSGQHGCMLPDWHMDCVTNPFHDSRPETHLIYSNVCGTLFMTDELDVREDETHFRSTIKRHGGPFSHIQAEDNRVYMFNRFNLHASPVMTRDCRRVIIRLTKSEVVAKK